MEYLEFKRKIQRYPVFSTSQLSAIGKDSQVLRNQLSRWQKKALIYKLRKGLYILNEFDRKINPSRTFIANQLYTPSYVSGEYALSFYGLIPERVADVTSVSTKKTISFKNKFGTFLYQRIKKGAYGYFEDAKDEAGLTFFIAQPEKAIVDFLYLNLGRIKPNDKAVFSESFRFQNLSILNKKLLREITAKFKTKKLDEILNNFCKLI